MTYDLKRDNFINNFILEVKLDNKMASNLSED